MVTSAVGEQRKHFFRPWEVRGHGLLQKNTCGGDDFQQDYCLFIDLLELKTP